MRTALLASAVVLLSAPAFALQVPAGSDKNADARMCNVVYNPNEVTEVTAIMGQTIAIQFGAKEHFSSPAVAVSDKAHLKFVTQEGGNMLWLKGSEAMPPQPVTIRMLRDDGTPRDYALQWTSLPDNPTPRAPGPVAVASANDQVRVEDASPTPCYMIRYQYPADDIAEKQAKWRASSSKARQDAAEIALHKAAAERAHNNHYVAQGDASIGPLPRWEGDDAVFDDGSTTEMHFPGNTRIPIILTVTPDGKESQVAGVTTEDGGVVKVHSVLPVIRLRDGDLVLCIFNRAFSRVGQDPGTGTTSSTIRRDLRSP